MSLSWLSLETCCVLDLSRTSMSRPAQSQRGCITWNCVPKCKHYRSIMPLLKYSFVYVKHQRSVRAECLFDHVEYEMVTIATLTL